MTHLGFSCSLLSQTTNNSKGFNKSVSSPLAPEKGHRTGIQLPGGDPLLGVCVCAHFVVNVLLCVALCCFVSGQPNSRREFAEVVEATSSSLTPFNRATSAHEIRKFSGMFLSRCTGGNAGASVSSTRCESGTTRTKFWKLGSRTTLGGTEKK